MHSWIFAVALVVATWTTPGTSDAVRVRMEEEELLGGAVAAAATEEAAELVDNVDVPSYTAPGDDQDGAGGDRFHATSADGAPDEAEASDITVADVGEAPDPAMCIQLPTWWKTQILQLRQAPQEVNDLISRKEATQEYSELMAAVYNTPRAALFGWKLSAIYKVFWDSMFESKFLTKGIDIFLRRVPAAGGFKKYVCFVDADLGVNTISDQYTDAYDGVGVELQHGVIAHLLEPVRSAGGPEALVMRPSDAATIDNKKFLSKRGIDELDQRFQTQIRSGADALTDKSPEKLAIAFLAVVLSFEEEFGEHNVTLTARYFRERVGSWSMPFTAYHIKLWVELQDSPAETHAPPDVTNVILPYKYCESLTPSLDTQVKPLEVQSLLAIRDVQILFTNLITEVVNTKTGSDWENEKVYQAMYTYEAQLLERGVAVTLNVSGSPGLCYFDKTQGIVDSNIGEFHDAVSVRDATGHMKDLPHSVFGEQLLNSNGNLVVPNPTPVDIQRMLARRGALEIHQEMEYELGNLTAHRKGLPVQIYKAHEVVQTKKEAFRSLGINVFTCFTVEDVTTAGGFQAHVLFPWIEFAETGGLLGEYRPTEAIPDGPTPVDV